MRDVPLGKVLAVLVALFLSLIVVQHCIAAFYQDFIDAFYMVASGEWMLKHGELQRVGISSPIPMSFVSQNWLFCVFAALCLRACEALGLAWYGMSAISIIMAAAALAYALAVARKETGGSWAALAFTLAIFLMMPSLTVFRVRAPIVMLTLYTLSAGCRYARGKSVRPLLLVPVLTVVHSNIQSATVLTQPLICFGYALSALARPHRDARSRAIALGLVGFASIAAAFVNPYGAAAVEYVFTSAGVAAYRSIIQELKGLAVLAAEGQAPVAELVVLLCCVAVSLLGQAHTRRPCVLETVMALLGIGSLMLAARNAQYAYLLVWWLVVTSWSQIGAFVRSVLSRSARFAPVSAYLAYAALVFLTLYAIDNTAHAGLQFAERSSQSSSGLLSASTAPEQAANCIERDHGGGQIRVLAGLDVGSYLEYRGFTVNITSRWETWEPAISGVGQHFFYDTVNALQLGDDTHALQRLLAVTEWDYIVDEIRLGHEGNLGTLRQIAALPNFRFVRRYELEHGSDGGTKSYLYVWRRLS